MKRNGLKTLFVTSRTQQGVRLLGDVELVFIPTALFAYQLGIKGFMK